MDYFSQAMVPLAWPVDAVPQLRYLPTWLPGTSFLKTARRWRKVAKGTIQIPFDFVRQQSLKETFRPSYVSQLLEHYGKRKGSEEWALSQDDEDAIKNSAAIMFGGGADTTVSTFSSFILAMILYPEIQRRGQKEVDEVVGSGRLPGFEDRDRLPYVNALVKETLRWLPVVPIGTTHVADEEVILSGYRIPKGAYLLPSIWWFLHNPETHPNPETFDPERFLEPRNEPDPSDYTFGYGRRICPGRHLADDNIYLTISRILATFNVTKALDKQGRPLEVEVGVTAGLISHPKPFPYSIKPRSAKHAELIRLVETEHPWEQSDSIYVEKGIKGT